MRYLLDANVVIFVLSGQHPSIRERMGQCRETDFVTSSIVYAEVALGSARGKPPPIEVLDQFVQSVPVLDFDRAAAQAYSTLPFKRASYDRLIAAHALALGLTVVTDNLGDFADVPGLVVENWTV
ncbi:MAG: type II toxin-antitoxin system VapC family toxin [Novosphingobium sp.]